MRMFSLFIRHLDSATPTMHMEVADDLDGARRIAQLALQDSPNRLAVEIREEDRLVFSLDRNGATWNSPGA